MGRTLYAPGVKTRSIQIDPLVKARSEGALDRLFTRPVQARERLVRMLTHYVYRNPSLPGASSLGSEEPVVRNYGFQPLTNLVLHTWYGERIGLECWIDPTGTIVMEVVRKGTTTMATDLDGRRTLATYFTDGTSLIMWDEGADLERLATPTRESMVTCGHFPQDIRNFSARIAELVASGKEVLHVWDLASLERRYELHARYMVSDGAKEAEKLLATAGFVVWLAGCIVMFLFLGWAVTWSWGAIWTSSHILVRIGARLGLFLNFDAWLYNRYGI